MSFQCSRFRIRRTISQTPTRIIGAEKPGDSKTSIQVTATQNGDMVEGAVTYGTSA